MKTVCKINQCNGCMACIDACPKHCITISDNLETNNALIDTELCINCKLCEQICPNINKINGLDPIEWKQGWANDKVREQSSSGGAASAIIKYFISSGGYVAACLFKNGQFSYDITNDLEYAGKFAGSKYVKSNPSGIYIKIQERLKTDKVLFIGLPCHVAALKNYIKNNDNLYTIDLICHGTPSVKLLDQYLNEKGYYLKQLNDIQFRKNTDFGLWVDGTKIDKPRVMDQYLCAFLEAINYTENCYSCQFASLKRVSDLTLGDSWGSEFKEEEKKGISLLLAQTKKGAELLNHSGLELKHLDLNNAIRNNLQLIHPSKISSKRNIFFKMIKKGYSFSLSTLNAVPKLCIKQKIKQILIVFHLIRNEE